MRYPAHLNKTSMLPLLMLLLLPLAGVSLCATHRHLIPITNVKDGDTVAVENTHLLSLPLRSFPLSIRIQSIDCPERGHRAKCPSEAALADRAKDFTEQQVTSHAPEDTGIELCSWDKYGGRILGDVWFWKGNRSQSLSDMLLTHSFAVPYLGRGTRHDWCTCPGSI
jgi:endonuclease YncB( thermonuclease family)